jgi:hypothetical protein
MALAPCIALPTTGIARAAPAALSLRLTKLEPGHPLLVEQQSALAVVRHCRLAPLLNSARHASQLLH